MCCLHIASHCYFVACPTSHTSPHARDIYCMCCWPLLFLVDRVMVPTIAIMDQVTTSTPFWTRWTGGWMFIPIPSGTIYPILISLVPVHPPLSTSGTYNRFHDHTQHNITEHQKGVQQNGCVLMVLTLSLEFNLNLIVMLESTLNYGDTILTILRPMHKPSKVEQWHKITNNKSNNTT